MSKQVHLGRCHICGEYGKLSREHIPLKSTFNSQNQKFVSLEDILFQNNDNGQPALETQYTMFQGGVNFRTLCAKCNSFTGKFYGTEYARVIRGIGYEILKIPKQNRVGMCTIEIGESNFLAFFKQVISFFCSINGVEQMSQFREFILDVESNNFNEQRYKVYMYLHTGRLQSRVPFQIQFSITTKSIITFSEMSTFPVGFVLYDVSGGKLQQPKGCDITNLCHCDYNKKYLLSLPMPFLECEPPPMPFKPI